MGQLAKTRTHFKPGSSLSWKKKEKKSIPQEKKKKKGKKNLYREREIMHWGGSNFNPIAKGWFEAEYRTKSNSNCTANQI